MTTAPAPLPRTVAEALDSWGIDPSLAKRFSMSFTVHNNRPALVVETGVGIRQQLIYVDGKKPKNSWETNKNPLPILFPMQALDTSDETLWKANGIKSVLAHLSAGLEDSFCLPQGEGKRKAIETAIECILQNSHKRHLIIVPDVDDVGTKDAQLWQTLGEAAGLKVDLFDLSKLPVAQAGWDTRDLWLLSECDRNRFRQLLNTLPPLSIVEPPVQKQPARPLSPVVYDGRSDAVFNPAVIAAVEAQLLQQGGSRQANGTIRMLSWLSHQHDKPGAHATYYPNGQGGPHAYEFSKAQWYGLKQLCAWLGIDPSHYGGLYLASEKRASNSSRKSPAQAKALVPQPHRMLPYQLRHALVGRKAIQRQNGKETETHLANYARFLEMGLNAELYGRSFTAQQYIQAVENHVGIRLSFSSVRRLLDSQWELEGGFAHFGNVKARRLSFQIEQKSTTTNGRPANLYRLPCLEELAAMLTVSNLENSFKLLPLMLETVSHYRAFTLLLTLPTEKRMMIPLKALAKQISVSTGTASKYLTFLRSLGLLTVEPVVERKPLEYFDLSTVHAGCYIEMNLPDGSPYCHRKGNNRIPCSSNAVDYFQSSSDQELVFKVCKRRPNKYQRQHIWKDEATDHLNKLTKFLPPDASAAD